MRKIKVIALCLMCLCSGLFLFACNEAELSFNDTEIIVMVGESVDPFEYLEIEGVEKTKVSLRSSNTSVAYITADGEIAGRKAGQAVVYAEYKSYVAHVAVKVKNAPVALSAPLGLTYNEGVLSWNEVFANTAEGIYVCEEYEVLLNGVSGQKTIQSLNTSISITEAGEYTAKVRSVGGEGFIASDYSSEISFTVVAPVSSLEYDDETQTLSWTDNENAEGTTYSIIKNGVVQEQTYTKTNQTEFSHGLIVDSGKSISLKIIASLNGFERISQELIVARLDKPVLNVNEGEVSWQAVVGADEYVVSVEKLSNSAITTENITATNYSLIGKADGEYRVWVKALSEESNIFTSQSSNILSITKLPKANLTFENRVFSVTNSSSYSPIIVVKNLHTNEIETFEESTYLFDKQNSDTYQIYAYFKAENASQIKGDNSETFEITQLGTSNITHNLDGNASSITLQSVVGATSYVVYKCYQDEDYIEIATFEATQTEYQTFNLGSNLFETVGDYTLKVQALNNMSGNKIYLSSEMELDIKRLASVQNIQKEDNILSWDAVDGAERYAYYFEIFEMNQSATEISYTTETSIMIPNTLSFGKYSLKVKAIGNDNNILSSKEYSSSAEIIIYESLLSPSLNFNKETNVLTLTPQNNIQGTVFELKFYNTDGVLQFTENTLIEGVVTKNVSEYLAKTGSYKVTAQAINENPLVANSEIETIYLQKLVAPSLIKLSGSQISVADVNYNGNADVVSNSATNVIINNVETSILSADASEFDIKVAYQSIEHRVVEGIKTFFLDSDYSEFKVLRLYAPTNLHYDFENQQIAWNTVENADSYTIFMNNQIVENACIATKFDYSSQNAFNFKVFARKEEFKSLGVKSLGNIGYVSSFDSEVIEVIKADIPQNLRLDIADELVLSWDAITNVQDVSYEILIDGVKLYETTQTSITLTQTFEEAKSYRIEVHAIGDNFLSSDKNYITLERLSAPTLLIRNNDVFSAELVSGCVGLLVDGEDADVVDVTDLTYEQGKVDKNVAYKAVSSSQISNGYYYLDSQTSKFSFERIATPNNLDYDNGKLTWSQVPDANYVLELIVDNNSTYKSLSTNEYTTDITSDFSFRVRAIYSQISVQKNETIKLSSDYSEVKNIVKENGITNLALSLYEGKVKITFDWQSKQANTPTFEVRLDNILENGVILEENDGYSYIFEQDFSEEKTYAISVKVEGDKFVASDESQIQVERLSAPQSVSIINGELSVNNVPTVKHILFNGAPLESLNLNSMDENSDKEITVQYIALEPAEITHGYYYLDSASSTFKAYKLETPEISGVQDGYIYWTQNALASSYTLKLTNSQGSERYIYGITQPRIELTNSDLVGFVNLEGNYFVEVMSVVENNNNLTTYIEESNSPVGYVSSNFSSKADLVKLGTTQEISISTDAQDYTQSRVLVSWKAVEGATSYTLILDGETIINTASTSYILENQTLASGNYTLTIVANAQDKISSDYESVTFSRLAPISQATVSPDADVNWTLYGANSYHFVMQKNGELTNWFDSIVDVNRISLVDNQYLKNFEGGIVNFKVLIIGDGTQKLSSPYFEFNATKLYAPTLSVKADRFEMKETGFVPENSEHYEFKFNVEYNGDFALDSIGNKLQDRKISKTESYSYPNNWEAGEYTFSAKVVSKTFGVISSNFASVSKTRLETISDVKFYRETLDDSLAETYLSDVELEYVSDKEYMTFTNALNATDYVVSVGAYSEILILEDGRLDITGSLSDAINGKFNISIISHTTDDSDFINSKAYEIRGTKLNSLSYDNFKTRNGLVSWVVSQEPTRYLIKISEQTGAHVGFWQSENSDTRTALLKGLSAGIKAFNIKAIGNVTTQGVSENIILDSDYLENAKQFNKLERPELSMTLGYISSQRIENASVYVAEIDGIEYELTNYAYQLDREGFVGYNASIASTLETNKLYEVSMQARSGASNVIYSDYALPINVKILENANTDLKSVRLELDASGDLTKTNLVFNLAENNRGFSVLFDGYGLAIYVGDQQAGVNYLTRSSIHEKLENSVIRIASLGSSEIETGNFYYLTSDYSYEFNLRKLDEPTNVRIEDGIIKWNGPDNASGYYAFIKTSSGYENIFGKTPYASTSFELPEKYGNNTSTKMYEIAIVAVSETTDYISSHWYANVAKDMTEGSSYYIKNVVKPHSPNALTLTNGSLVWQDGLSGLNDANTSLLGLMSNLNKYLGQPLTFVYSSEIDLMANPAVIDLRIEMPNLEFKFINKNTGREYKIILEASVTEGDAQNIVKVEYLQLINYTQDQIDKITEIQQTLLNTGLYNENSDIIKTIKGFVALLTDNLEKNNGLPNISCFFDEIKNNEIPAGEYEMQIKQLGKTQFLNSNYFDKVDIYIPDRPMNVTIEAPSTLQGEKIFYLSWDNVNIRALDYSATDKYFVVAENKNGVRKIVAKVNETPETAVGDNRTRINLTELVNNSVLTPDDVKIFVVVAGDSNQTIHGIRSNVLNIEVLPEVEPYMANGYLSWNILQSAYGVQIITTSTENTFNETIQGVSGEWVGDTLTAGVVYATSMRAVGEVYMHSQSGVKTFIISGKKVDFSLQKLEAPTVSVNTKGIFEWNAVQGNVSGYVIEVGEEKVFLKATDLSYESTYAGYNSYKFRAKGDSCEIITKDENGDPVNNTYYINSLSNRQAGKDYDGYFGVMLPEITEIQIEQGKLKWKAVNLENYTVNNILDTENYKRRVMYKIIIGENIYYVEQENNALDYMIFEDFDNLPSGTFEITIQAYIYWKSSLETLTDLNVTITNNVASDYFALLGESGTTETGLISKASAITADEYVLNGIYVENGMLIWDFVKEYDGYEIVKTHTQYIVTYANATEDEFSSGLLSLKAEFTSTDLYAKWWSETMTENTDYNIKIRVFGDNEYLNSNYVTYSDVSGESETRVVSNLGFASMLVGNKIYPFGDENHNNSIKIELDRVVLGNLSNTYNYGFEIRYRAIGSEDEWETYDYGYVSMQNDANPDVATYVLDISQLSKTSFEYQIRLTLRDENNTKWLKSNWSEKDNFNVPTSIEKIYYDENRQEIYFADEIIPDSEKYYGYIITDEILNENNELIETRKYLVKAGIHSGEKYCVVKDGVNYIYYSPTVLGNHRISVRKTPDLQGALVSTACYYKSENETGEYTVVTFDLFTCGGEGEHGSVANPYLIENEEDFKNLAYRAYKYDYLKNVNIDGNDVNVDASYYFKQTKDISLTETINGQLSTYFDGNYDGNNFELTYGLTDNGSASLFGTIEKKGVFRNTILNVKFTPSSSNISLASVAQINEGSIVNNVLKSFDITSSAGTITYAGFVVNNKGTLQKLVANANLEVSNVLKASGIASENTGTISQCGNNGNISLTNERSNAVSGIVNSNYKDVIECYNKGSLTINSKAGVVSVGGIVAGNDSDTTIIDCYNTGVLEITSINHNTMLLGGIVASSTGNNIENCYVTQQIVSPTGSKYSYGAIVGYFGVAPVERNNYYLSGSTYAIGNNSSTIFATAKTESEMKNTGFFEMLNKDAFVAGKTSINKGYPVLIWENGEDLLFNKVG